MNKDQVEGKGKDVAGRVERQAGEWTGDREKEVHGILEQVEGKLQSAWGNAKNPGRRATDKKANLDHAPVDDSVETEGERENEEDAGSWRRVN